MLSRLEHRGGAPSGPAKCQGDQTLTQFYDNAQNVYGVPTPVWTKLGFNIVGRTVFLDHCLRNTTKMLLLAFNVWACSFAPAAVRAGTRQFANVESLRKRGPVEEWYGQFATKSAPRTGPFPFVRAYPHDQHLNAVRNVAILAAT